MRLPTVIGIDAELIMSSGFSIIVHHLFLLTINSCLIDGLCKISKLKIARELFQSLPRAGLMPNVVTYDILIRGLCNDGQMDEVHDLFFDMEAKGVREIVSFFARLCERMRHQKLFNFFTQWIREMQCRMHLYFQLLWTYLIRKKLVSR